MEYKFLIIILITVFLSQITKIIIEKNKDRQMSLFQRLNASGGTPSTHSAAVSCLSTIIGLNNGFDSSYFAICFVLSIIVIYDAMGVRYQVGKQARIINKLNPKAKLNESIGHRPIEVLYGVLFGIILGLILNKLI